MPIVPIRNLGKIGVITDVDPFDLPTGAFTMAVNARFEDNRISRGPVSGLVGTLASQTNPPQYIVSYREPSGVARLLMAKLDGTITDYTPGGSETSVTATGWTSSNYTQAYTAGVVNDVVYLNRPDRVPWFMTKEGTLFAPLTNWTSTWRCKAMRTFNGQVIAMNVTQAGIAYPTMVAWSDFTVWQAVPGTWAAAPTNSAGSNVLSDLGDPLIDGLALRSNFVLYSQNETWAMNPTGDTSVFSFYRLFNGWGMISQNCATEVNNVHYVFGYDKIWRHDGFSPQNIGVGRIEKFVYENMDRTNAWQNFVVHKPRQTEVMFCYRSTDPFCAFPINGVSNYQGCNRAAVYNYRMDTWYFYDLPYVTAAGYMTPNASATYTSFGTTPYTSVAGAYSTYGDTSKLVLYLTSQAASAYGITSAVRSFEVPGSVYQTGTVDTAATPGVSLYTSQINLDELGANIRGYKVLKSIYPEGRLAPSAAPLTFTFSSSDYANTPIPAYGNPMTFDGGANYKLDFMVAGRFIGMKIAFSDIVSFSLSGFDADFEVTGSR